MKKLTLSLVGLVAITILAQSSSGTKANTKMTLTWDENPIEDAISVYNVFIGSNKVATVKAPPVELTTLMTNLTNGEYQFSVTAVGESGIESLPSDPLWVFWYGNKPLKPATPRVEFNR